MLGILYAAITVLAWGTWLAPSQRVVLRNEQTRVFYVTWANLLLALVMGLIHGLGDLTVAAWGPPFVGGLLWAASGQCAFTASSHLGIARAFGIWAPLNILVSLACGRLLFGEFRHPPTSPAAISSR